MFVSLQSFIEEYKLESAVTLKLLNALTDESLKQEVAPGYRTLGELAWHIAESVHGLLSHTGLQFEGAKGEVPTSAAAIAEAYRTSAAMMLDALKAQWTDATLQEVKDMFGQQWPNGLTLSIFLKHEIHHRGQITILMRQAGVPVTGAYGPSKEEWQG